MVCAAMAGTAWICRRMGESFTALDRRVSDVKSDLMKWSFVISFRDPFGHVDGRDAARSSRESG